MFLNLQPSQNGSKKSNKQQKNLGKKEYQLRDAQGNPVILPFFMNPERDFDRQEIESPRFKGFLEKEYDFRNKGNRIFLQKAESFKEAWMEAKFGSPYCAPLITRNVGRIFIPPTNEAEEVELARV